MLTPLAFLAVICMMVLPKLGVPIRDLKGGEAAALVGGTAAILMLIAAYAADGLPKFFETSADHITSGFVFAFKAMGSVLPIAGFFFIGAADTSGAILGLSGKGPDLLFEVVTEYQRLIPAQPAVVAFGVLLVSAGLQLVTVQHHRQQRGAAVQFQHVGRGRSRVAVNHHAGVNAGLVVVHHVESKVDLVHQVGGRQVIFAVFDLRLLLAHERAS